jgi:hypothetical protein
VDPSISPTRTSKDDWKKLDRKVKRTIRLCLSDSILLNVNLSKNCKGMLEMWKRRALQEAV